jgi:hypothetical protein
MSIRDLRFAGGVAIDSFRCAVPILAGAHGPRRVTNERARQNDTDN